MDSDATDRIEKAEQGRDRYRQLYLEMLERCRMLEKGLLGQKSEKLSANEAQLTMQVLGGLLQAAADADEQRPSTEPEDEAKPPRKHRKRTGRQLPENLPRIEIEILPEEVPT